MLAARTGRGDTQAGSGLLLDAVAAALIAYAVLGPGSPIRLERSSGAIFVGMLLNGLTMLNMQYFVQDFIKGVVLVSALAFTLGLSKSR